jgi:Flp pilus assembly protein CpaB
MVAVPIGDEGGVHGNAHRRLRSRLSSGHVLMIVAGLLGALLGLAALRSEPAGVDVVVAAHEIRGGEAVRRSDFRTERVQAPDRLLRTLIRPRQLHALRGHVATSTVEAGEVVIRRELRPRAARGGLRSMSIPIDPARAVGGRLAVGDRVDVLNASDREVSIVVRDAEVLAVDAKGRGGIGETSSPFTITIAVDARQSQLLAAAIANGDISIARTTGAASSQGTTPQAVDRGSGSGAVPGASAR